MSYKDSQIRLKYLNFIKYLFIDPISFFFNWLRSMILLNRTTYLQKLRSNQSTRHLATVRFFNKGLHIFLNL